MAFFRTVSWILHWPVGLLPGCSGCPCPLTPDHDGGGKAKQPLKMHGHSGSPEVVGTGSSGREGLGAVAFRPVS